MKLRGSAPQKTANFYQNLHKIGQKRFFFANILPSALKILLNMVIKNFHVFIPKNNCCKTIAKKSPIFGCNERVIVHTYDSMRTET